MFLLKVKQTVGLKPPPERSAGSRRLYSTRLRRLNAASRLHAQTSAPVASKHCSLLPLLHLEWSLLPWIGLKL